MADFSFGARFSLMAPLPLCFVSRYSFPPTPSFSLLFALFSFPYPFLCYLRFILFAITSSEKACPLVRHLLVFSLPMWEATFHRR